MVWMWSRMLMVWMDVIENVDGMDVVQIVDGMDVIENVDYMDVNENVDGMDVLEDFSLSPPPLYSPSPLSSPSSIQASLPFSYSLIPFYLSWNPEYRTEWAAKWWCIECFTLSKCKNVTFYRPSPNDVVRFKA